MEDRPPEAIGPFADRLRAARGGYAAETNSPTLELEPHTYEVISRRPGRVRVEITCPFCGAIVTAYRWSLGGSGKLCPGCGAKHTLAGTYRRPR